TSQDHDRDAAQEALAGRYWMDIGTGGWDRQGRPSEVRVNRIVRIDPDGVRRIGAILDRRVFDAVAAEVQHHYAR
nr:type II toxin-antitoxin system PemK/MazF family toxin [Arachnia sp.]